MSDTPNPEKPTRAERAAAAEKKDTTKEEDNNYAVLYNELNLQYQKLEKEKEEVVEDFLNERKEKAELAQQKGALERWYRELRENFTAAQREKTELERNYKLRNEQYKSLYHVHESLVQKSKKTRQRIAAGMFLGSFLGFSTAAAIFSSCNSNSAGNPVYISENDAGRGDAGLSEVVAEAGNERISELEKQLKECQDKNQELSKRPKYCPKLKKQEPVACPLQPECPHIKQY